MLEEGNNHCFECEKENPQWACLPFGIILC